MISIRQKDYTNPPARLLCDTSKQQIRRAADERDGDKCNSNVYRDEEVVRLLKAYSIGKAAFEEGDSAKCYYCESKGEAMGKLQIEHYRPKDAVSKTDLGENEEHKGYYWLGNEWSNLLLACAACNAEAKGTRFPIEGKRQPHAQPVNEALNLDRTNCILSNDFLLSERPKLLNPEYDTPEDHITFTNDGDIREKSGMERGRITIEILNLKRLKKERAKKMESVLSDLIFFVDYYSDGRGNFKEDALNDFFVRCCSKILIMKQRSESYTLWGRYINDNFEDIFVSRLAEPFKPRLRTAYLEAANNNP